MRVRRQHRLDPAALIAELEATRIRGHAEDREENEAQNQVN
jgi:DNA-binding IclR family transcriptional regulator